MDSEKHSSDNMIYLLRGFAGMLIFAGVVGSIVIGANYGTVEVVTGTYYQTTTTEANPLAIGLAIAVAFQGVVTGVFLLVFAQLAESVARIEAAVASRQLDEEGQIGAGEESSPDQSVQP